MASLMDNLVEVLEKENTQYEKLVELAQAKRQAVISANVADLVRITEQEQEISGILQNLGSRRDNVLKDMADVLGKDFKEMTITRLVGYLNQQPKEQERLSEIRARILATGSRMQEWNRRNEELLKQALEMVEFDLTLFKSMRQAPETANYNRSACNTGDLLGCRAFDAKQ